MSSQSSSFNLQFVLCNLNINAILLFLVNSNTNLVMLHLP